MQVLKRVVVTVDELSQSFKSVRLVNVVASLRVVLAEVDAPSPLFNKLLLVNAN